MPTTSGHTKAIRAKRVIGTSIKDAAGNKLGEVEDVMLDKQSDGILFAVVGVGGVLGVAKKYHPLPWSALAYDKGQNAYVVNYTKEQLEEDTAGSIEELTREDGLGAGNSL